MKILSQTGLISNFFNSFLINKISISGPESCGKTSLANWLAREFNVPMVPEMSREFLESGNLINHKNDILHLAKKQIEAENKLASSSNGEWLICDTDVLVLYIWCREKFSPVPAALDALVQYHRYNFTLLCSPDLPWVHDPWRENPTDRQRLFVQYKAMLDQWKVPYAVISGSGIARYHLAKKILSPILK
ncbi:MAG: ATP-binding protein [Saprospiraceae bacterium]